MKEEEFDAMFRSKIEAEDSEPIWDEAKVWDKIKPIQGKKRVVYWPYAASVAMLICGVVLVLLLSKENTTKTPVLSEKTKSILDINKPKNTDNEIVKIKLSPQIVNTKNTGNINKSLLSTPSESLQTAYESKIIVEDKKPIEDVLKNEVVLVEQKPVLKQINLPKDEKTVTAIEPKNEIKKHTIVLNIPIENEDKSVRKKRVVGRFFQQVNRYSNGEKFDWEEVNIRPKAIWSYLKKSFTADSTATSGRF